MDRAYEGNEPPGWPGAWASSRWRHHCKPVVIAGRTTANCAGVATRSNACSAASRHFRRVFTRYDKTNSMFSAFITLAFIADLLRSVSPASSLPQAAGIRSIGSSPRWSSTRYGTWSRKPEAAKSGSPRPNGAHGAILALASDRGGRRSARRLARKWGWTAHNADGASGLVRFAFLRVGESRSGSHRNCCSPSTTHGDCAGR